jgi:hypothetical protein
MTTAQLAKRLDALENARRIHAPIHYWTDEELAQVIQRAHALAKSTGRYHAAQLTDEELKSVIDGAP